MAWKSGRKGDNEKRESQLGTPALSEASYDEKRDAKAKQQDKQTASEPGPKPEEAKAAAVQPVPFKALFRYVRTYSRPSASLFIFSLYSFATPFEVFINWIGIIAAAAAGAALVCLVQNTVLYAVANDVVASH